MSNGNGKQVSIAQAISWILAVATFFAGVTFAVIGGQYNDQVKDNTDRIRRIEVAVAVQSSQYQYILTALTELKAAIKERP